MKLLIVDDDPLIQKSLSISLSRENDIEITGCARDGAQALKICAENTPDIVLMDIRMPGIDGIAATRILKERYPEVRILMLTTFDDKPNIRQALAAGADGYLVKTEKITGIAPRLRILMDGTGVLGADVLKKLSAAENPSLERLTPRERDIARLVAQGMTNKEIASHLYLGEGTVRNNIVVIMEKLGVSNRTQLGIAYYDSKTDNGLDPR